MSGSQQRFQGFVALALPVALLATATSCSHPQATQSESSAFHWSAAKERYLAGDYQKAIGNLDQLLDASNDYHSRALPFSLVLTSGVTSGYMELADYYVAGAKANKAKALVFLRKASDYRAQANHMLLRFAEETKKMDLLRGDSIQLAFGPPKGGVGEPVLLKQISHGIELSAADEDAALSLAMERGVLLTVCNTAGASNNLAKASEILQRGEFLVRRSQFMKAVADQLERESQLYARNKLDDSAKIAMLKQLAQEALKDAASTHTAMVTEVSSR